MQVNGIYSNFSSDPTSNMYLAECGQNCQNGYWGWKTLSKPSVCASVPYCDNPDSSDYFNRMYASYCRAIPETLCPAIGGTDYQSTNWYRKPISGTRVTNAGPEVYVDENYKRYMLNPAWCSYDVDQFQTYGDILTYEQFFGASARGYANSITENTLDTAVYPSFCALPSDDCPIDPLKPGTTVKMPHCSRFISTDPEGEACRLWASRYPAESDAVKQFFCAQPENFNLSECACINRVYDPDYKGLKKGIDAPDFCWYFPCANSTQFLVPSTITEPGECPSVCGAIVNNYNNQGGSIHFDRLELYVSCLKGVNNPTGAAATVGYNTTAVAPVNTNAFRWIASLSVKIEPIFWIMLGVGVGLILILIIIMATLSRKK